MPPVQLWLFDDPPITQQEIARWVSDTANLSPESWRFAWYVENWNVAGKIRAAKLQAARGYGKSAPALRRRNLQRSKAT